MVGGPPTTVFWSPNGHSYGTHRSAHREFNIQLLLLLVVVMRSYCTSIWIWSLLGIFTIMIGGPPTTVFWCPHGDSYAAHRSTHRECNIQLLVVVVVVMHSYLTSIWLWSLLWCFTIMVCGLPTTVFWCTYAHSYGAHRSAHREFNIQ